MSSATVTPLTGCAEVLDAIRASDSPQNWTGNYLAAG